MSPRMWLRFALLSALTGSMVALSTFLLLDWLRPGDVTIGPATASEVVVVIDGEVATPGPLTLPAGTRLHTAIEAAGGFTSDADTTELNLAGRLGDGEHITIPSIRPDADTVQPGGTPGANPDSGLININTANVAELDQLPGVGPVIAQRIIDFREIFGEFESIDQLEEVDGISAGMVDNIRPRATVDD